MTHQEINEAISRHLGWKSPSSPEAKAAHVNWQTADRWWIDPDGHEQFAHNIPDYLNDLNAMHEAEKVLVREQRFAYWHELNNIVMGTVHVAFATAAQRAEAFLKTLNLWK